MGCDVSTESPEWREKFVSDFAPSGSSSVRAKNKTTNAAVSASSGGGPTASAATSPSDASAAREGDLSLISPFESYKGSKAMGESARTVSEAEVTAAIAKSGLAQQAAIQARAQSEAAAAMAAVAAAAGAGSRGSGPERHSDHRGRSRQESVGSVDDGDVDGDDTAAAASADASAAAAAPTRRSKARQSNKSREPRESGDARGSRHPEQAAAATAAGAEVGAADTGDVDVGGDMSPSAVGVPSNRRTHGHFSAGDDLAGPEALTHRGPVEGQDSGTHERRERRSRHQQSQAQEGHTPAAVSSRSDHPYSSVGSSPTKSGSRHAAQRREGGASNSSSSSHSPSSSSSLPKSRPPSSAFSASFSAGGSSGGGAGAAGSMRDVSLAELRQHCREGDCWIAVKGVVYNATSFLTSHPGGLQAIAGRAGTDVTRDFQGAHSNIAAAQHVLATSSLLKQVGRLRG